MEDNRPDDIDRLFKDGLQPLRRKPSKAVWDRIEGELGKDDRRLFFVRFRLAFLAAAGLFILVGGSELYFHPVAKNGLVKNHHKLPSRASMSRHGDGSGDLVLQSPGVIRDTAGVTAKLSLPGTGSPQTVPPLRIENYREGGRTGIEGMRNGLADMRVGLADMRVGIADMRTPWPARSGRPGMGLAPVGSRARISAVGPAQHLLAAHPTRFSTSSTAVLQRPRRWAVTGFYSSEFAGYNLTDQDSMAANGKEVDKKEKHVFSSAAMVLVSYKFSRHWVFETGLGYSWAKSHASPTTSYAVNNNGEVKFQVNTLSGYGYVPVSASTPAQVGDSVSIEHSSTTLHYLNAPFMLSYALRFKRFTLMPGAGFSLNILTGARLETKLHNASYNQQDYTVKMYGLKRLNYGVLLKAELGYAIDSHWSIAMVASFKNALTPINLHTVVATYPYNLGVGAGIGYSF